MPDIETDNRATWTAYGTHQLARGIAPPELDRAWRFRPTDTSPGPLFVPTAQRLTAWDPALPLDHPAAWFQPCGSSTGPATTADATRSTW